mmetsp:Transcript_117974/g.333697  ORF Transcript_117974/g.333697 Transcript_117974/m.333697 type:complete len:148 (+) Transcript_117974:77-520(+)
MEAGLPPLSGSITFIYAKNFEASCAFYGQVLGLDVAGFLGDGVRIFALPGAYLGIVKQGVSVAANPPRCAADVGDTAIVGLFCSSEADVDAYHARILSSGVGSVEAAPTQNDTFGLYSMLARDPNGYLVEVQALLNPNLLKPLRARI